MCIISASFTGLRSPNLHRWCAPDTGAPTDTLTTVWRTFRGHSGQNVIILGTNRNRCTQRLAIQTLIAHGKLGQSGQLYRSKSPTKNSGRGYGHFQASWASHVTSNGMLIVLYVLISLPDLPVGGLMFYSDSSFFLFRQLPSELAERNSTISGHII